MTQFLAIGRIVKPHGVRGEVKVTPYTDVLERFTWLKKVYVGEKELTPVKVKGARLQSHAALLKLEGYNDRNAVEELRDKLLLVPEEDAVPLEEGEYYLYQLEGLAVYTDDGRHLGELVHVIETKANNVFEVNGELGDVLLPDIDDVILDIDFANGRMTVHLLPGLLP